MHPNGAAEITHWDNYKTSDISVALAFNSETASDTSIASKAMNKIIGNLSPDLRVAFFQERYSAGMSNFHVELKKTSDISAALAFSGVSILEVMIHFQAALERKLYGKCIR